MRPTLITWLCKDAPKYNISVSKIDSLLRVQTDGPVVQLFKKSDDRVTLTFRDVSLRDEDNKLISDSLKKGVFQSVSVPQKTYPAITRLSGLSNIQSITGDDPKQTRDN
jgi:hypothetical protein